MKKHYIIFLLILFILLGFSEQKIFDSNKWELVTAGLDFPEGPAWSSDGVLFASNCYGSWITKYSNGKLDTLGLKPDTAIGKTNGLCITDEGDIIACDYGLGKILLISSSGKVSVLIEGYNGKKFNRPNDITLDSKGNIYFTDPHSYGKDKLDGRLFYYNISTKTLSLLKASLAFPNGINISPDGKTLYMSESAKNRVLKFDVLQDGSVTNEIELVKLPGGDPDGIDIDEMGNLYIAHYGTGTLFVVAPSGKIITQIKTPGKKPTNIEFGDNDLRTLYLTEVETNSIYKIRVMNKGCNK